MAGIISVPSIDGNLNVMHKKLLKPASVACINKKKIPVNDQITISNISLNSNKIKIIIAFNNLFCWFQ